MAYDVVIRGGSVIDGTGAPAVDADVAIQDGRIAAIGRIPEKGVTELDAEGHAVTPGFVDGHTHMDAQVFWDQLGTCSCWHGVTTVVMGNCGFTLAPARGDARALVVRNLERAEDISPAAMAAGIDWTWETFAEYLDAVDRIPKAINYAAQLGHSALRTWAMGERAFEQEATADDLAKMEGELRSAMRAGAWGFTSSRTDQHETSDNRPVASRLASWDEVRRLVIAMGPGVFEITPEPAGSSPDEAVRNEWYARLRALALDSQAAIALPAGPNPTARHVLDLIDGTVEAGGRMFGLSHCRGISALLSFRTQLPFDNLAEWKPIRALAVDEQLQALRDPVVRERLVKAANEGDYGRPIGAEARRPKYDLIQVLQRPVPPNPTVAELARERNVDPAELMIDLALETNGDQFFFQPLRHYADEDIVRVLEHPRTAMTFSDAGAHVSQIADFSIQTYLLAYWVRERQRFSLEDGIRMITSASAEAWGLQGRGVLAEGAVADVNVLDPATVGPAMPTVAFDLPSGAKRLVQKANGFKATFVAGQQTFRDGKHTGALPGALLRGPQSTATA